MAVRLNNGIDANGRDIGLRPFSDKVNQLSLAANVSERTAIPSGYTRVLISGTANVWILPGDVTVAAANTGDVTDGSASELNAAGFLLDGTAHTHIAVISDAACIVTFTYYN